MIFFKILLKHYKDYYSHGLHIIKYAGVVGVFGYPIFYFIYTKIIPQTYENLSIRAIATLLCLLLALQKYWPEKLKNYYLSYSYWVIFYCLPFFHVFMSLKNQGSIAFIADSLMAVIFLILLTDWRNTFTMIAMGGGLGTLLYIVTTPNPVMPIDYVQRLPTFLLILLGGSLFKFSEKQTEIRKQLFAKTALAGSIAHEMRNPLGQIKYSLDSIEHALPTPSSRLIDQQLPAQKLNTLYHHLAQGQLAIKRGLQVISMTLDEVSSKTIEASDFVYLSAAKTTQKAVEEYSYETEEERNKINVVVLEDFTFKANETIYIFVLFNLIKNALYYFKLHPEATLTITIQPSTVKVKDTGPGMSEEALSQLFQAFKTSGKSGGTGLGLAYCQRAMRAFGGEISCDSALGEYTAFRLQFPPVSQTEIEGYEANFLEQASSVFQGKHILLVDDHATLRKSTRHMLQPLGCNIEEAEDGQQALAKLKQRAYDLIIMDLNMPVLDGYATAEKIRAGAVPGAQFVPIVAYSSESAYMAQVKTQKVGMNGFISKPCSQIELIQALQEALEHAAKQVNAGVEQAAGCLVGKTVLIADDDAQNRRIVRAYVTHWGMQVREAEHGMQVLERLQEDGAVDVILMDMQMPGMSGIEATRAIRAQIQYQGLPIIALTGNFTENSQQSAQAAGMNDFISKPLEALTLREKLVEHLGLTTTVVPGERPHEGIALLKQTPDSETIAVIAAASVPVSASETTSNASQRTQFLEKNQFPVLNTQRLEDLKSISPDLLEESLIVWVAQIKRLSQQIKASTNNQQLEDMHEALHSLLGISGSAGAVALPQFIKKQVYPAIDAGRWPDTPQWLETIESLSAATLHAIAQYQEKSST